MEIKKIAEEQEIWDDNEEAARLEEKAKKIVVRIENDGLGFYFILFYFILFYFSFIFSYLVENKTKKTKCDRKEIAQWKSLYPYIMPTSNLLEVMGSIPQQFFVLGNCIKRLGY